MKREGDTIYIYLEVKGERRNQASNDNVEIDKVQSDGILDDET